MNARMPFRTGLHACMTFRDLLKYKHDFEKRDACNSKGIVLLLTLPQRALPDMLHNVLTNSISSLPNGELSCFGQGILSVPFYRPQTKFGGQGNFSIGACLSMGRGAYGETGYVWMCGERVCVWQIPPWTQRSTLPAPRGRMKWPLKHAVRILLECILVFQIISRHATFYKISNDTAQLSSMLRFIYIELKQKFSLIFVADQCEH